MYRPTLQFSVIKHRLPTSPSVSVRESHDWMTTVSSLQLSTAIKHKPCDTETLYAVLVRTRFATALTAMLAREIIVNGFNLTKIGSCITVH
jgi:hypothetical protein